MTRLIGLRVADGAGVWLEAGSVSLSWNAARLLRGELDIPQILVEDLTMLRPPAPGAEPPELRTGGADASPSPFDWPRAPVPVILGELRIERAFLDAPVLGQAIRFDARGRAEDQGDIQAVALSVTRTDAVEGRIDLSWRRDFARRELALNLSADEAAGGLVATLAGFPPDAATRIRLRAEGPRDDWRVTLDAGTERVWRARGTAAVDFNAPVSARAELTVSAGPDADPDLAALIAPRARLTAAVSEADGRVAVESLSIDSPALRLAAAGHWRRADNFVDLSLTLDGGAALARITPGLSFDGFGFEGSLAGTPADLNAAGRARLAGLMTARVDAALTEVNVTAVRSAGPAGAETALTLRGSAEGVRLDRLAPGVLGRIALAAEGRIVAGRLRLRQARLDSAALTASLSGEAALDGQEAALSFSATLPALDPLAAAYGLALTGAIEAGGRLTLAGGLAGLDALAELKDLSHPMARIDSLRLRAQLAQDRRGLAFRTEALARGLAAGPLTPALLGPVRLDAAGRLEGDSLTVNNADLTARTISLGGAGVIDLAQMTGGGGYQLIIPDLAPLAAARGVALAGSLSAEGLATLSNGTVALEGSIAAPELRVAGRDFSELALTHALGIGQEIAGRITLAGREAAFGPVSARTDLAWAGGRLALTGIALSAAAVDLGGDVTIDPAAGTAAGRLEARAASLAPLGAALALPLAGAAEATLTLSDRAGRQDLALRLSGRDIGTSEVSAARLAIDARLADALGRPVLRLSAEAADGLAGPVLLERLTLAAEGPPGNPAVTLDGQGRLDGDALRLSAAARLSLEGSPRAAFSRLEADIAGTPIRQQGALTLALAGGGLRAEGIALAIGEGRLAGRLTLAPRGIAGDLDARALDLTLAERFVSLGIMAGRLDADASFDTGRGRAEISARAAGVRLTDLSGTERALGLTLTASWQDRRASLRAALTGGGDAPLEITAALPLAPAGALPRLIPDAPLSGRLQWSGEIGQLWVLLPLPGQELTGPATIDLALSGTPARPRIDGTVGLRGARFQDLTAGTILTDLDLRLHSTPEGALAVDLSARDGAQGQVTLAARIDMTGPPRIEGQLTAREAVLLRRDDIHARISADLTLAGPVAAPALSGRIAIDRAEIRLVDATPPAIVDLGPVRMPGEAPPEGATQRPGRVALDLRIEAPGLIFVRGRGLDSEWRAELTVRGTSREPRIAGAIEKLRGSFDLLGRSFDLEEGRISFAGGRSLDPRIDLVLVRRDHGITGRITATGRIASPEIGFSSIPALPEAEVLPRLLFGTSRQSLSAGQAIQLAAGINRLMSGERGVMDTVRDTLGVDVLQVDPGQDRTSITVGKSLAPGLFVGARRDLTGDGDSAVTVEIDLFDGGAHRG
ncbi:MAG: translocation/assembly module TamB [Paracoccaceae bacterium]|nr:MAG: translocation/assembly module TamB [Paracoccaceae bacterium]